MESLQAARAKAGFAQQSLATQDTSQSLSRQTVKIKSAASLFFLHQKMLLVKKMSTAHQVLVVAVKNVINLDDTCD